MPVQGLVIKDPWGNAIRFVHPKFQGGYGDYANSAGTVIARTAQPMINSGGVGAMTLDVKRGGINVARGQMQIRRSYRPFPSTSANDTGDADEGLCAGGRGYFYSPGPDKDAGTRADNVYSESPPVFPTETANFN